MSLNNQTLWLASAIAFASGWQPHQGADVSAASGTTPTAVPIPTQDQRPFQPGPRPAHTALAPLSGQVRGGIAPPSLVAADAPAPVEVPATLDDSIPLPNAPVYQTTPDGDVEVSPASGDPFFLGFAAGPYYPPSGELVDPRLYAQAHTSYADGRPAAETYAFAMFQQRMTPERIAQLEDLGARVLGVHPHYALKLALPAEAIDLVANDPSVRWLGVPQSWQKIHPALTAQLGIADPHRPLDVWINLYDSDLNPQSRPVLDAGAVTGGPDGTLQQIEPRPIANVWISNGWMQHELERIGVDVLDYNERIQAFRCEMMPQALELVTALDFVQFVEYRAPKQPMHDESMPLINADDVRVFYDGNTSSRAVGGIVDTGVETSHTDLGHAWWVAWNDSGGAGIGADDACGHGSHVAGTILGDGSSDASKTGVSPDLGWGATGRFFIVRVFATCAGQAVNVATNLSHTSSSFTDSGSNITPAPHVTNNSWGTGGNSGSPWVGSEADPRMYDDNAYSGAQINVFAAGNSGPTSGTVGEEASAKNVITVGNVVDYNDASFGLPGALWAGAGTGSSQGPCGDGRWKPTVCAPGRWIESVDGFTAGGYTEKYGTSMAAPHVTGTIADMIDANSMWAYLPERVAAQLMATAYRRNDVALSTPSDTHLDQYGAGRIDGTRAIWSTSQETWTSWAFTQSSGTSTHVDFTVPVGATRLVAVMNYSDPQSSSGASQALVNNWDLYLDQPPLSAGDNSGDWVIQQSSIDNTEIRVLNSPVAGGWQWKVWPQSTSSTAYFGVTIFIQTADTAPDVSLSLSASDYFVTPGQGVAITASANTPTCSASGVFLDSTSSGNTLSAAGTTLRDGAATDLLGNEHLGRDLELGNLSPFFGRTAHWTTSWATDGIKPFSVTARGDNFADVTQAVNITVDGTPPGLPASVTSSTHTAGVWSNNPNVTINWTAATDNLSGIDGYGVSWGTSVPLAQPANAKDTEEGVLTWNVVWSNGATWYFGVNTVDNCGNWSPSYVTGGPFKIDTTVPVGPSGLTSSTHPINVQQCGTTVTVNWTAGSDALSGLVGYLGVWNTSALFDPTGATNIAAGATSNATNIGSSGSGRYFHLRAKDNAGNYGTTQHYGPVFANATTVTTYCTAKTNSLGCLPAIGSVNQPDKSAGTFQVTCTNVLNQKNGLLFWGFAPLAIPFQGGTKCVASPTIRGPNVNSGGSALPANNCTGNYAFTWTTAYMNLYGLIPGDTVYAQWWTRDPAIASTTGLSNGIRFTICQ